MGDLLPHHSPGPTHPELDYRQQGGLVYAPYCQGLRSHRPRSSSLASLPPLLPSQLCSLQSLSNKCGALNVPQGCSSPKVLLNYSALPERNMNDVLPSATSTVP